MRGVVGTPSALDIRTSRSPSPQGEGERRRRWFQSGIGAFRSVPENGAVRSLLFDDVDFAIEGVAEGVVVFGVGNVEQ
jgi:hypothetical protein